jgi:hypothetical protein
MFILKKIEIDFLAAEVLTASHPIVKLKPLAEASAESRTKAR